MGHGLPGKELNTHLPQQLSLSPQQQWHPDRAKLNTSQAPNTLQTDDETKTQAIEEAAVTRSQISKFVS